MTNGAADRRPNGVPPRPRVGNLHGGLHTPQHAERLSRGRAALQLRRRCEGARRVALGAEPVVRQLEARLGVSLLTRTSRSVALTDAGRRLLEHAGPAVEQALESLKTVSVRPGEVTGKVRLSVPAASVSLILAHVLPRFITRYPKVEVDVPVEDRFVDIVAEGLDAGIRLTESIERDMVQIRLSDQARFVVAGAPSYFARRGTPQKPADLLQHDCICMRSATSGGRWAWELERGKKEWRVPVQGPAATNDLETQAAAGRCGSWPRLRVRALDRGRTAQREATRRSGAVRAARARVVPVLPEPGPGVACAQGVRRRRARDDRRVQAAREHSSFVIAIPQRARALNRRRSEHDLVADLGDAAVLAGNRAEPARGHRRVRRDCGLFQTAREPFAGTALGS